MWNLIDTRCFVLFRFVYENDSLQPEGRHMYECVQDSYLLCQCVSRSCSRAALEPLKPQANFLVRSTHHSTLLMMSATALSFVETAAIMMACSSCGLCSAPRFARQQQAFASVPAAMRGIVARTALPPRSACQPRLLVEFTHPILFAFVFAPR